MKWIPVTKAKVKFGQQYLIFGPNFHQPELAYLAESKTTSKGVRHLFDTGGDAPVEAYHVAAVTLPGVKEEEE